MDAAEFRALSDEWHADTAALSSDRTKAEHPAWQQIVAAGPSVAPLMLADLRDHHRRWYTALRQLVDDPPTITNAMAGDSRRIRDLWLAWGRERGYLTSDVSATPEG